MPPGPKFTRLIKPVVEWKKSEVCLPRQKESSLRLRHIEALIDLRISAQVASSRVVQS